MPISTKNNSSLLIVASSQNTTNSIKQVMGGLFGKVAVADTMVLAKQKLAAEHYDSLIINAPLTDENGIQAALDIAARLPIGILLLVSGEIFDKVAYRDCVCTFKGQDVFPVTCKTDIHVNLR